MPIILCTKTELDNGNSKIDSAQNQIDHMLTTLDVDTRTTLYEGTAATKPRKMSNEKINFACILRNCVLKFKYNKKGRR